MMKRRQLVLGGLAIVATSAVSLPLARADSQAPASTLTGCLRAGSAAGVYLLRGAAIEGRGGKPDSGATPLEDFLLVSVPDSIDLGSLLNHRVAVTGGVSSSKEGPTPPPGANTAERALKRIAVQGVREVASNCAAPAS